MSRHLVHALVVVLSAGVVLAEGPKSEKGETVKGRVKKVDPSAHQLVVTVGLEKAAKDRDFDLLDSTRFVFYSGGGKKEVKGKKEAYKNEELKEGANVVVVTDAKGKVTEVRVGDPPPEKEKK